MKTIVIRTMDRTGDTRQQFDLDEPQSKAAAVEEFDRIRKGAGLVVTVPKDGPGEVVRSVEDLADENLVVPAIVSG